MGSEKETMWQLGVSPDIAESGLPRYNQRSTTNAWFLQNGFPNGTLLKGFLPDKLGSEGLQVCLEYLSQVLKGQGRIGKG